MSQFRGCRSDQFGKGGIMGLFPILLTASIAGASVPHAPARLALPDPVHPAMWKIEDGDTTIFLFGTFHALDGSTHWFKDRVKTAFHASDQLVLETLVPRPQARLAPATISLPTNRSQVLAQPASFAASTQLVLNAGRKRGMSPGHGADAVLRLAAEGSGKRVGALESFEFQINMFSSLRAPGQPQPQAHDPNVTKSLAIALAQLQDAWVRGDMATFAPMLDQMRVQTPQAYRTMFVERNARWAGWIAGRMREPGTVFVAVGAGHLAGSDSVQNQLAAIGVGTTRVN